MSISSAKYLAQYSGFTLTQESCGQEPIHRPILIHSHGYLIARAIGEVGSPLYLSANLASLFDITPADLWAMPVREWMNADLYQLYSEQNPESTQKRLPPIPLTIGGQKWIAIRHSHQEVFIIELEPLPGYSPSPEHHQSSVSQIRYVTDPLVQIETLPEVYRVFTQKFREVTGYSRVMIYQFDPDYHGSVVGESFLGDWDSFLGLHFPASDIPPMARELFLKNRSRIIPAVDDALSPLIFNPALEAPESRLDLTHSQLRATSPIHIQYLKNMGVGATFTLALIIENRLWGLIACHHQSPHFISYEMRQSGELIASFLCNRISQIINRTEKQKREQYFRQASQLDDQLKSSWDIVLQLADQRIDLQSLLPDCDGAALITSSIGLYTRGLVPPEKVLLDFSDWLARHPHHLQNPITIVQDIRNLWTAHKAVPQAIGGVVIMDLPELNNSRIMWFKIAKQKVVDWAGDPDQTYTVSQSSEGLTELNPRKSFKKWQSQVQYQSEPWDRESAYLLSRIREVLLKKQSDWNPFETEAYRKDLQEITYAASHDLREPLRTVENYLTLIHQQLGSAEVDLLKSYVGRSLKSVDRMGQLINNMLLYSRIGNNESFEQVRLTEIVKEISEDLATVIASTNTTLHFKDLPRIYASKALMRTLLQNLISNAIKYRRPGVPPEIHIQVERAGNRWILSVADNGIGIEQKHFEKIFSLFKRLHHRTEIEGTGIGLAICRKIVAIMNGKIWVTSELGVGTTIWCSLESSNIPT